MNKLVFFLLLMWVGTAQLLGQTGTIRGIAIDQESGEPIMFANVTIPGTDPLIGEQTDLDGAFQLTAPEGTYTVEITYVGYAPKRVADVEVRAGETTVIGQILVGSNAEELETVVVTASQETRTANAVLALRRKALTVQDNFSSQEMAQYGANNAAESMKRVTGASVVGGKYIFVRGLGDRYTSAQLNGLQMPSTDPYRNAVQLDLIPSNLLDNIIAEKTFLPDQPGNFTGGNVNLNTKSFPDRFTLAATISATYNTQSSFRNDFLTHEGGANDWLGFDDGSRDIPDILESPDYLGVVTTSTAIQARTDERLANLLDAGIRDLGVQRVPGTKNSFLDHRAAFSIGNQYDVGKNGDKIGVLAGLNYTRSYEQFENGRDAFFELTDPESDLNVFRNLTVERGQESARIGGLFNLSYKFGGSNKVSFLALYNNIGGQDNMNLQGAFPAIISGNGVFQTRSLRWQERNLRNYQLSGEHALGKSGIEIAWAGGLTQFQQEDPNFRQFSNTFVSNANEDTTYFISPAEFDLPFHFFRNLEDEQYNGKVDITIPIAQSANTGNRIKIGGFYSTKDRLFRDNVYQIQLGSSENYMGDPDAFFGDENSGIMSFIADRNRYRIGLYTLPFEKATRENSYDGTETFSAAYGMVVYNFGKLRVTGGARVEMTDIRVQSLDTTLQVGAIEQTDFLPALNLTYELADNQYLRLSATQTLSRPNMRELAPFVSFDYGGANRIQGRPDLRQTLIQNYDLRWEIYPRAGELLAVSAFFKQFQDPIVTAFVPTSANPLIQYTNVDQAQVYGIEVEARKKLDFISPALENFKLSSNFSLIQSIVDIPDVEQPIIDEFNPAKGDIRQFQGQSPYLLNVALNYTQVESGIDAILSYNVFGRRLSIISEAADPDVFEEPVPTLDFSISKRLANNWSIRFRATNLLNPDIDQTMRFRDREYLLQRFRSGRNFGLSLTYRVDR